MALLPETNIDLTNGVEFVEYPNYTWYADANTGRISGMADGYDAIKQAVEIMFSVERFYWQIYSPNFGMQWEGLTGKDHNFVAMEILRRANDAIRTDKRMQNISDFSYSFHDDVMTVSFMVNTVFGDIKKTMDFTF